MPQQDAEQRSERLDQLAKLLRSKVTAAKAATLDSFVRRYFGQMDSEDLAERELADL